jgi:hypothetical protein
VPALPAAHATACPATTRSCGTCGKTASINSVALLCMLTCVARAQCMCCQQQYLSMLRCVARLLFTLCVCAVSNSLLCMLRCVAKTLHICCQQHTC